MSKVYEALKKAQREGRWREDNGHARSDDDAQLRPADTISPSNQPALERGEEILAAPQVTVKQEPTAPPQPLPEPAATGSQDLSANSAASDGIVATELPEPVDAPLLDEPSRERPFWRLGPNKQTHGPRLIVSQESLSRAAEQFQVLRANLEGWATERNRRVILITSALPGEGKSFVAVNLAMALSRAGSNVLLVDADLRDPSLHVPFNLVPLSGLLPYLEAKTEFTASITETREPRLRLIAAGGVTLSAPEILAGLRMKSLIEYARQLQPPHIVLIDAPAAAAGAEAQILSNLVDGTLLVIAANKTPRAAVTRTLELIKGVPLLSAVLNRFEFSYSSSRHLHQ